MTLVTGDRVALFPDAPTSRGTRHLQELMALRSEGYRAAVVFIIQREAATSFAPNEATDPPFYPHPGGGGRGRRRGLGLSLPYYQDGSRFERPCSD